MCLTYTVTKWYILYRCVSYMYVHTSSPVCPLGLLGYLWKLTITGIFVVMTPFLAQTKQTEHIPLQYTVHIQLDLNLFQTQPVKLI